MDFNYKSEWYVLSSRVGGTPHCKKARWMDNDNAVVRDIEQSFSTMKKATDEKTRIEECYNWEGLEVREITVGKRYEQIFVRAFSDKAYAKAKILFSILNRAHKSFINKEKIDEAKFIQKMKNILAHCSLKSKGSADTFEEKFEKTIDIYLNLYKKYDERDTLPLKKEAMRLLNIADSINEIEQGISSLKL